MMRAIRSLAAVLLATTVAACGGEASFEPATTRSLARRAENLAAALEAGRPCAAASLADELEASVEEAVSAGAVPAEVGPDLIRVTRRLRDGTACPEPTPSATPAGGDQDGGEDTEGEDEEEDEEEEDDRPGGGPPDEVPPDVPPGQRRRDQ